MAVRSQFAGAFVKLLSMLADNFTIASYEVLAGTLLKIQVVRNYYAVPTCQFLMVF
jgi:hypothetical protein